MTYRDSNFLFHHSFTSIMLGAWSVHLYLVNRPVNYLHSEVIVESCSTCVLILNCSLDECYQPCWQDMAEVNLNQSNGRLGNQDCLVWKGPAIISVQVSRALISHVLIPTAFSTHACAFWRIQATDDPKLEWWQRMGTNSLIPRVGPAVNHKRLDHGQGY